MKDISEITQEELDNLKIITFDIDGVIAPIGTVIKETTDEDSIDLYMESKKLSDSFIEDLKKLEKHLRLNFSSGRNILYLKSLVNQIFDEKTILQAENGNITWVNNQITHPKYSDEYFNKLRDIKERIKEIKKTDKRIRGFEPKFFILTVHCDEMEEIPQLVKEIGEEERYCLWTNEGYDIGNNAMSKGKAIEILAKAMEISPKQIMTTGNNYNDQEMVEIGKGVTVEPERIKAEYFIKHKPEELGGELLVKFLLEHFEKK